MEKGQTLPGYLKELRKACHYKQEYVASKLNIARQTYSHYETGRIKPPACTLHKLARLYGVSMEELFGCMMVSEGEDAGENREACQEENTGRPGSRFLQCFLKLDERDQRDIISIMEMKIKNQEEETVQKAAAYKEREKRRRLECRM